MSHSTQQDRYRMLSGHCPDAQCRAKLYFPSYDSSIECTGCGQRHDAQSLDDVQEVTDPEVALHNMVRNLLVGNLVPRQTADSVKVLGLSNYHCKLLSPLLTHYGMDRSGRAQPLASMDGQAASTGGVFDCGLLGDRAFLLQPEHIGIMGYGRDQTGSAKYLKDTLEFINQLNGNREVLVPIHADGDGHCLVHGISRALVGRELFWHALRTNLKAHFLQHLTRYKNHFSDFLDSGEWEQIVVESDPDYLPSEAGALGLQNIHIFGLANVLRRPIILLDSLKGLQSSVDYSGVFLPVFVPHSECRGKDGTLHKPLCIAWSSKGRNHFIALVGVKGHPLPRLPRAMLTKAWGAPSELINTYINFDKDDMCTVGGDRSLPDKYVQKLAAAMEEVFVEKYCLHPAVVADVHHYIYKRTGVVGLHQNIIIANTRKAIDQSQLFRCLLCGALSQIEKSRVPAEWLRSGGELYELAKQLHGQLTKEKVYAFPLHELNCSYDPDQDELVPDQATVRQSQCTCCQGKQLRQVKADGSMVYFNGDRTSTPATRTKCNCGFKHYWDGKEYDNNPSIFTVPLNWRGRSFTEEVMWFQSESDPALNSNAYDIASALVQKHFPGEFGSEKLVQQVVATILQNTAVQEKEHQPISLKDMPSTSSFDQSSRGSTPEPRRDPPPHHASPPSTLTSPHEGVSGSPGSGRSSPRGASPREKKGKILDDSPSKIILTGPATKTLHKEELTLSETERQLRRRIEERAPLEQRRSVPPGTSAVASPTKGVAKGRNDAPKVTDDVVAMDTGSEPRKKAPEQKRIRLTSSDGRQATLVLDADTTFADLQSKIESELNVEVGRQRIRYGFPPKELKEPTEEEERNQPVPLRNGDRVTVEVIAEIKADLPMEVTSEHGQHSVTSVTDGAPASTNQADIVKGINQETGDNLDLQLYTLNLMMTITHSDMWTYVKQNGALFERGGLFHSIVERDLGLTDGKHFMLPSIPNKKFTYNAVEDRIEICLEPTGHFPVGPGLDEPSDSPSTSRDKKGQERQDAQTTAAAASDEREKSEFITGAIKSKLKAGSSGVVTSGGKQVGAGYRAFSGHAHTLSSAGVQPTQQQQQPPPPENQSWARYQREFCKLLETSENSPDWQKNDGSSRPTKEGKQPDATTTTKGSPRDDGDQGDKLDRSIIATGDDGPGMEQSTDDDATDVTMEAVVRGEGWTRPSSPPLLMEVASTEPDANRPPLEGSEPVYKRLGPGYTVLVQRPDAGPVDPDGGGATGCDETT